MGSLSQKNVYFFDYYLVIQDLIIGGFMIAIDWGTTNF